MIQHIKFYDLAFSAINVAVA